MQPTDLSQYISDTEEDVLLCVAPAEHNKPETIQNKEASLFPLLFPEGKQTFEDSRPVKMTLTEYIKCRFFCANNKYAQNPEYIFYLQYLKEFNEVLSSLRISLRKGRSCGEVTVGELTTGSQLREIVHRNEGYKFLSKVRGSAPYWERTLRDLCAMVRQLGVPTWFTSFSAADRRWKEIACAILTVEGKEVPAETDWSEHCRIINSNPVIAAAMFDKRAHHLLKDLILSAAHPLGNVIDYFYRIEFQQRGWPHIHALFWVENAPTIDEECSEKDEEVITFIDRYITCSLPSDGGENYEEVLSLQSHSKKHSKTCKKCRKQIMQI